MKNAYYFSHDTNARRDPKIMALRKVYGAAGYGYYWMITEAMAEASEYKLKHKDWQIDALAMEMLCKHAAVTEFIDACVERFELFESDGEFFWSPSLLRRMKCLDKMKEKRSEAGKKGAKARWVNSNAITEVSGAMAKDGKGKERKGKEIKESKEENRIVADAPKSQKPENHDPDFSDGRTELTELAHQKIQKHKTKPPGYRAGTARYGPDRHVWLFPDEYEELKTEFGEKALKQKIISMDSQIENRKPKYLKYKNHCSALRNWLTADAGKPQKGKSITEQARQHGNKITELWASQGLTFEGAE
jgi:hypothetical protein